MTKNQFYGWSREDAAPLNEAATPRPETFLTRRLRELKQQDEVNDERSESVGEAVESIQSKRRSLDYGS